MKNIRPASAAGKFYTEKKDELLTELNFFKKKK